MNKYVILVFLSLLTNFPSAFAQEEQSSEEEKNTPKITVGGYIDTYIGYDTNGKNLRNRPYFVSSARTQQFAINLAFVDVQCQADKWRAVFRPAMGTYMAANYAAEPDYMRYIYEGYAGAKLSKKKEIWLDMGVFSSPYTNENAISKDHLNYSRSYAPEYVPYYLSGLRLTAPLSSKVNFYAYLMNGWQVIQNEKSKLCVGTNLEIKPNDRLTINWTTFLGSTETTYSPLNRFRAFSDVNILYNMDGKFSMTFCAYYGIQERQTLLEKKESVSWGQANIQFRYKIKETFSLSGRLEYFEDPDAVQIATPVGGFSAGSATLGVNKHIGQNCLWRTEVRQFFASDDVYMDTENAPTKQATSLMTSLAVWF